MPEKKQTWMEWLMGRETDQPSATGTALAEAGKTAKKVVGKPNSLKALQRAGQDAAAKRKAFDEENRKAAGM